MPLGRKRARYTANKGDMETKLTFEDQDIMRKVCGSQDCNLSYIEFLSRCSIRGKGNILFLSCETEESLRSGKKLIEQLMHRCAHADELSVNDIFLEYRSLLAREASSLDWSENREQNAINVRGKLYLPRTKSQELFIEKMQTQQITIACGPAGTGKTFLAVAHALSLLLSGKCQKIVLTRPVVEAGESLGFLPGDLNQKINPYLRPLYDAMDAILGPPLVHKLETNGSIEVAPMAYMRGRSLQNAVVLLDEAQNTTREQMLMFLTRIGENASAIVTGDESQIDLPRPSMSGLIHALGVLGGIEGIGIVRFTDNDVVRARIVQKIIHAYAAKEKRER